MDEKNHHSAPEQHREHALSYPESMPHAMAHSPYSPGMQMPPPLKHSGVGITAFIMSFLFAGFLFVLVIVAGVMETSTPGGIDETGFAAAILGLLILAAGMLEVVALVLGLAGLFQRDRKKLFAIFGTIISSLTLLAIAGLMIIGITTA